MVPDRELAVPEQIRIGNRNLPGSHSQIVLTPGLICVSSSGLDSDEGRREVKVQPRIAGSVWRLSIGPCLCCPNRMWLEFTKLSSSSSFPLGNKDE